MSTVSTVLMTVKIFQSYYEQNILENESASNISWIGSMQYGFLRLPVCRLKFVHSMTGSRMYKVLFYRMAVRPWILQLPICH